MKKITILLGAVLALACGNAALAADVAAGEAKAKQLCASCHAVGGDWTKTLQPDYPRLAGQHADYLVTALTAYKQGDKSLIGRKNAIMGAQAAALSEQDIQNLAAYLSKQTGTLSIKR